MVLVAPELEKRLDAAWNKLQQTFGPSGYTPGISQIDLDTACVQAIEVAAQTQWIEMLRQKNSK